MNEKSIDKSVKQTIACKKLIESCVGDILDSTWTFIPIVYFHERLYPVPQNSQQQVLTQDTDWRTWYKTLIADFPLTHSSNDAAYDQVVRILQLFIFCFHKGRPIVKSFISDEVKNTIDLVTTASNILFYSKDQLQLMANDAKYHHVVFHAQYGTGKFFCTLTPLNCSGGDNMDGK